MSDVRVVYFAFHYADIWEVNQIRNSDKFIDRAAAGFKDGSLWEEAKKKGDAAIKRMIDDGLYGSSETACLIGQRTAYREYVDYELEQSYERGNLVLGIYLPNQSSNGTVPGIIREQGAMIYTWDPNHPLGDYIADAERRMREARR